MDIANRKRHMIGCSNITFNYDTHFLETFTFPKNLWKLSANIQHFKRTKKNKKKEREKKDAQKSFPLEVKDKWVENVWIPRTLLRKQSFRLRPVIIAILLLGDPLTTFYHEWKIFHPKRLPHSNRIISRLSFHHLIYIYIHIYIYILNLLLGNKSNKHPQGLTGLESNKLQCK